MNKRSLKVETLPDIAAECELRISLGKTVHLLVALTVRQTVTAGS